MEGRKSRKSVGDKEYKVRERKKGEIRVKNKRDCLGGG
jgi:hypothetical protein